MEKTQDKNNSALELILNTDISNKKTYIHNSL